MSTIRPGGRRRAIARGGAALVVGALAAGLLPVSGAGAAVAPAPANLAPDDRTGEQRKNLELTWAAVDGATSYQVQVSNSGSYDGGALTETVRLARWTVPVSLPRGDYIWRVRAIGAAGTSAWSEDASFTRGWNAAPTGAATHEGPSPVPAISWAPLPDASFYEIEFSRVPFQDGSAAYEATGEHYTCYTAHTYFAPYGVVRGEENPPGEESSCAFDVVPPEEATAAESPYALNGKFVAGQEYFWRVRGRDSSVDPRTTPFKDPALSCTGVWFESGVEAAGTADARVPVGGEPPEYAGTPDCSQWLEGGSFTVGEHTPAWSTARPPHPGGLALEPTDGAARSVVQVSDTPLFRWHPVEGAAKYRVYSGRTADARDADHVWETYGTSLLPLGTMEDHIGVKRYWTVQACTLHALCSAPAPVQAYTKSTALTTQPHGSTADDEQAELVWTVQQAPAREGQLVAAAPQAKAYQLQVAWGGYFSTTQLDTVVDRVADHGDTRYARHVLDIADLRDGLYRWRVRPVDEGGQQFGWSRYGSFVRDRAAPSVSLTTKAGFAPTSGILLTFTERVSHVDASTLGVVVPSTGRKVGGRLTSKAGNSWLFTPSQPWVAGQYYAPWVSPKVVDIAGKPATAAKQPVRAGRLVDSASPAMRKARGDWSWVTYTASDALGASYVTTSDNPATAPKARVSTMVRGTQVTVYGCRSPRSGHAPITVDGRLLATLDLYQSYTSCGRLWTSPRLRDGEHAVVVTTAGKKRSTSKGYYVSVDAVTVS